jgi:hypothetical protein
MERQPIATFLESEPSEVCAQDPMTSSTTTDSPGTAWDAVGTEHLGNAGDQFDSSPAKMAIPEHCNKESSWAPFRVPKQAVQKSSWCIDIVTPDMHDTNCFTKSYARYIKGTGSVLATENLHILDTFPDWGHREEVRPTLMHMLQLCSAMQPIQHTCTARCTSISIYKQSGILWTTPCCPGHCQLPMALECISCSCEACAPEGHCFHASCKPQPIQPLRLSSPCMLTSRTRAGRQTILLSRTRWLRCACTTTGRRITRCRHAIPQSTLLHPTRGGKPACVSGKFYIPPRCDTQAEICMLGK